MPPALGAQVESVDVPEEQRQKVQSRVQYASHLGNCLSETDMLCQHEGINGFVENETFCLFQFLLITVRMNARIHHAKTKEWTFKRTNRKRSRQIDNVTTKFRQVLRRLRFFPLWFTPLSLC